MAYVYSFEDGPLMGTKIEKERIVVILAQIGAKF
jgi:hypothetical protein